MHASAASRLRAELVGALARRSHQLRQAIRGELGRSIVLEPGRRLQFEVDPWSLRVTLCVTEHDMLPDEWLSAELPEDWFARAEDGAVNWDAMVSDELCPWF